jgi:prephenate dehydrogenase
LVLVSTYVGGVADDVCSILSLPKFKGLVVDTGSVKRPILEAVLNSPVDTSRYVPGHPMAGRNEPGPVTASADIMRDKVFLLCEHPDIRETAPDRVQAWLSAIGFRPYRIDAESHDAILSISSHLPHVVAYALGRQLAELGSVVAGEDIDALSGRSIRSILDFASPNFAMWESILFANRGAVLKQGRALSSSLDALLDAVEADDLPRLKSLLEQGSAGRGILFNETAS